jgi:hypothetical protein
MDLRRFKLVGGQTLGTILCSPIDSFRYQVRALVSFPEHQKVQDFRTAIVNFLAFAV